MNSGIIETDAVIVGAGPCGLFQVFELGLQGIRAHVVDSMPVVGGQCAELYPDKPIYDIPGIPYILAQELVDNLMEQIAPFEAEFHLGQEVAVVEPVDDRFEVETSAGTRLLTKTVFLAGGVGSFQPRRISSTRFATPRRSRARRSPSSAAATRRSTGCWSYSPERRR